MRRTATNQSRTGFLPVLSAYGRPLVATLCAAALAINVGLADARAAENTDPPIEITPIDGPVYHPALPELPDLTPYTTEAVRNLIPRTFDGRKAQLRPLQDVPTVSLAHLFEMSPFWLEQGDLDPKGIVLQRGTYTLEMLEQHIDDAAVFAREAESTYLLRRPIIVLPNATLVIRDGEWLKLDLHAGVFISVTGQFIMADSSLTTWDRHTATIGKREEIPPETLLLYGLQKPRPFYLAMNGSKTYMANSHIAGLGYKGINSTFGLSLSPTPKNELGLGKHLRRLPDPTGWFIGNRIESLFFGFYTHKARDVVVVGNDFVRNVIYAIDPHDYSVNLIIARNIVRETKKAHGIIFSRGVADSWIFENVAYRNAGSGIMLDRDSTDNVIYGNTVIENLGDGIAIYESNNALVWGNDIRLNGRDGIYVRNSWDAEIRENNIQRNGENGIEVAVVNIDFLETRDFELDPYDKRSKARIVANIFDANTNSAVATKDADIVHLAENHYMDSGPLFFSGDLETIGGRLIRDLFVKNLSVDIVKRGVLND